MCLYVETTGEDILDESGFKLEWEEPTGGEEAGQDGEEKAAILVAALRQVTKHGWSEEALREGARSVGVAELDDGLFPNGGGDLVQYFEKQCHDDLVQYLQDLSKEKRCVSEALEILLWANLGDLFWGGGGGKGQACHFRGGEEGTSVPF